MKIIQQPRNLFLEKIILFHSKGHSVDAVYSHKFHSQYNHLTNTTLYFFLQHNICHMNEVAQTHIYTYIQYVRLLHFNQLYTAITLYYCIYSIDNIHIFSICTKKIVYIPSAIFNTLYKNFQYIIKTYQVNVCAFCAPRQKFLIICEIY